MITKIKQDFMVPRLVPCQISGSCHNAVEVFVFWDIMQCSLALVYWHLEQTITPTFKGQAVPCFTLDDGTNRLSWNVGIFYKKLPTYTA